MTAPGFVPPPLTGWWVKRNMVPFPLPASLLLAGSSPFVRLGPKLFPSAPTLALTGGTTIARVGTVLRPTASTATLTGSAPIIRGGPKVLPSPRTLTLTGGTPTLPVMFDATGPGFGAANAFTTSLNIDWLHTATGANGAVTVAFTSINSGQTPASQTRTVTYAGINMTQLVTVNLNSESFTEIWGLLAPPGGSQTVSVTISSGANTGRQLCGASVSYTGVDSFGPTNTNTGTGTALTQTVGSTVTNERIVQCFGALATQSGYTQTQRVGLHVASNQADIMIGDASGGGSVGFASTGGLSAAWAAASVRLQP